MSQERVIVTGGVGMIGSGLVEGLNRRGCDDILVVDRFNGDIRSSYLDALRFRDTMDADEFRRQFSKNRAMPATTVFHMGACSSTTETDAAYLDDNNFAYTRELCEWCLRTGARFVYASSAATYGDGSRGYRDEETQIPNLKPLNLYGLSKQKFDLWALENGALDRIAGLKYFNVYGPREDHKGDMRSVVHKAYRQIQDTGSVRLFKSHRSGWRDGEQERDFVFVRDAVAATLFFHEHPEVSGLFNCGTGRARTWLDLAHALFAALGREPRIVFEDMPSHLRERYQYHTRAEMDKLRAAGYRKDFTSLEEGVQAYVREWLADARFKTKNQTKPKRKGLQQHEHD